MPNAPHAPPGLSMFLALYLTATLAAWVWAISRLARRRPLIEGKPEPSRLVPWGLGAVLGIVFFYLALQQGIVALIDPWIRGPHAPPFHRGADGNDAFAIEQMLLVAVINLIAIVLVPMLLAFTTGATWRDLGLVFDRRILGWDVVRGVVACLLVSPIVYGIQIGAVLLWQRNAHPMETMIRDNRSLPVVKLALVSAVLLAPIAEELFFRGVLMGWLTKFWGRFDRSIQLKALTTAVEGEESGLAELVPEATPPETAWVTRVLPNPRAGSSLASVMPNVVTSLLFAGVHAAQWPAPLPIFTLSLALGALYQRTGRLIAPIVLHGVFNGVSTLVAFGAAG
jgi:membrane protease YdiL (CAAX protease family)